MANGQVMAIYSAEISSGNNTARLSEKMILGQSRIGILKPESDEQALLYDNGLVAVNNDGYSNSWYGQTQYEITNYLGNVNAVISDKRISLVTSVGNEVEILMKSDYYPFGMPMADRQSNSNSYRYGYNSVETDNEASGTGNSYTTEFRQYDPRLGRWKSLDPLMMKFPWMSPYVAFDNNPVFYIDPYGLEATNEGDPPTEGTTVVNPKTGTTYSADGEGGWFQEIPEVQAKLALLKRLMVIIDLVAADVSDFFSELEWKKPEPEVEKNVPPYLEMAVHAATSSAGLSFLGGEFDVWSWTLY